MLPVNTCDHGWAHFVTFLSQRIPRKCTAKLHPLLARRIHAKPEHGSSSLRRSWGLFESIFPSIHSKGWLTTKLWLPRGHFFQNILQVWFRRAIAKLSLIDRVIWLHARPSSAKDISTIGQVHRSKIFVIKTGWSWNTTICASLWVSQYEFKNQIKSG